MTPQSNLLAAVVAVGGFAPLLLWGMAAGPFRLSRRATRWWLLAALLGVLGQLSFALRSSFPAALQFAMPGALLLVAHLTLRRGVVVFFRQTPALLEDLFLAAVAVLLVTGSPWIPSSGGWNWSVVGLAVANAWVLADSARLVHRHSRDELDAGGRRAASWPLAALAIFELAFGLAVASPQAVALMQQSNETWMSEGIVLAGMVGSVVINFPLSFLVVMRLIRKLQRLSRHDPLTDLMNRRAMEEALQGERLRHLRSSRPYTVLMIDVDHFKRINDTYGHAAGDAALVAIADLLRKVARNVDQVARMGGEEFCVLLPETPIAGALQAAERLRMAIERRPARWQGAAMAMTISVGVAEVCGPDETVDRLLERADQALYRAKAEGRNRVVVALAATTTRPAQDLDPVVVSGGSAA